MDPNQLLQLAQDRTADGRYRLANEVSRFFETRNLTEAEQRIASEIMIGLIRQAEVDLREALAERLSVLGNVPSEIIVFLANDDISVARPVLQRSPILNDDDLVYIIASKGRDHWRSIATREKLSPAVTDRLVDTGDSGTAQNLVGNKFIVLQKHNLKKIIRTSLKSEDLQASLLRRPEIDGDLVADLYTCVSETLRQEISKRFQLPADVLEASLESLTEELSQEAKGSRQVTTEMVMLARRFKERGEISPVAMVRTLRRGQVSFFIALFAERLGFTPETIVKMIQKDSGKPFTLACRSIGMMKSEFASIFLLSRGVRTGDKIVDQRELAMALKHFDTIKEFDVQRIMKAWQKDPELI